MAQRHGPAKWVRDGDPLSQGDVKLLDERNSNNFMMGMRGGGGGYSPNSGGGHHKGAGQFSPGNGQYAANTPGNREMKAHIRAAKAQVAESRISAKFY